MTTSEEQAQANKIQLTKESSSEMIKLYFEKIYELRKSKDKFPVDLDDVWPLVYAKRDKAYSVLTDDYIQDVDYQIFSPNGEKLEGRPKIKYNITVSCLEYFIVKKVRRVFDVYRRVFYSTLELKEKLDTLGIAVTYLDGDWLVNYKNFLKHIGYSATSGWARKRKELHPEKFKKLYQRNYITLDYADELKNQSPVQLTISFSEESELLQGDKHDINNKLQ